MRLVLHVILPAQPGPVETGSLTAVQPGWRHGPEPSVHWEAAPALLWDPSQRHGPLSWIPEIQQWCDHLASRVHFNMNCSKAFVSCTSFKMFGILNLNNEWNETLLNLPMPRMHVICYLCQSSDLCWGDLLALCLSHSSLHSLLSLHCWLHLHWLS